MIDFTIPADVKQQMQMLDMVASQVMRPHSRELDENEHERPTAFFQMTWPIVKETNKGQMRRIKESLNGNGSAPKKSKSGGLGKSYLRTILAIEIMSWGDTGQYLCLPGGGLGGAAVDAVGTPEQRLKFLSRFAEGDEPSWAAMAITEPDAGSDNSSMRTTAVLDPETNEWIINGEKIFITSGSLALKESDGFCVVWATVDPDAGRAGIKSFVVEAHTPGVGVSPGLEKLGIRASDTVVLSFQDVRVPYENLLGSAEVKSKTTKGFQGAMKTFDSTRPAVAASAMGIARAAVEFTEEKLAEEGITIDYRKPRNQMSAMERDLIEMKAMYKSAWLLTLKATAGIMHGNGTRLEASMSKAHAGEAVTRITQKSVELLGPMGYSREWLAEKWMRDAKINDIYEGTRQINLLIVARTILGYTRRELK
ncbi:MAG TPA: acyl-CoA dehydrogenase family protein [Anaerolineae bacterium]|nr:acyl-CoA dehydrogenase family protein [Anaerolineae bacterium]